jgi:hypothetical protein
LEYTINGKKAPQILCLAVKRAGEWSEHSWKWLQRIRNALLLRVQNEKRKSTKSLRVDQRIAIHKLLVTILSHVDLKSLCIGYYDKQTGVFIHLGVEYLAKKSGLCVRRTQRALQWLYESGYLVGHRRSTVDEDTGEYIHKTSIRKVSLRLFLDLGITEIALNRARNKAKKKVEGIVLSVLDNQKPEKRKGQKGDGFDVGSIIKNLTGAFSTKPKSKDHTEPPEYLNRIRQMQKIFPTKTINEIKLMLPDPHTYK